MVKVYLRTYVDYGDEITDHQTLHDIFREGFLESGETIAIVKNPEMADVILYLGSSKKILENKDLQHYGKYGNKFVGFFEEDHSGKDYVDLSDFKFYKLDDFLIRNYNANFHKEDLFHLMNHKVIHTYPTSSDPTPQKTTSVLNSTDSILNSKRKYLLLCR